jgi:hypothetical protein
MRRLLMKKWTFVVLLLVGATVLGATVLREPMAWAAQDLAVTIINPVDAQGNVKVHEQGTVNANVQGTVDANVTNSRIAVGPTAAAKTALSPLAASAGNAVTRELTSGTVNASLVVVQFDFGEGLVLFEDANNHGVLQFRVRAGHELVVPLAETVQIKSVSLACDSAAPCGVWFNVVGS